VAVQWDVLAAWLSKLMPFVDGIILLQVSACITPSTLKPKIPIFANVDRERETESCYQAI
jgi:hypothetical protein